MPGRRLDHQRQEHPRADIDPAPADVEGPLPALPRVGDDRAAAADAGVVEEIVDVVGRQRRHDIVPERRHLSLVRDVGDVADHLDPLRQTVLLAQAQGLGHGFCGDVAHGHVAAFRRQLTHQLAPHARPAAGHHGDLSAEVLHVFASPFASREACAPAFPLDWQTAAAMPRAGEGGGSCRTPPFMGCSLFAGVTSPWRDRPMPPVHLSGHRNRTPAQRGYIHL